jgi:hypothetical protein
LEETFLYIYMCVFMYVKSFSLFTWKTGNMSVYSGRLAQKEENITSCPCNTIVSGVRCKPSSLQG